MVWQTYLVMYFGTGDVKPTDVVKKVESVGFVTAFGPVDFIYDWGNEKPTKEQVLGLGDKLVAAVKNSGCVFNLDTHD